MILISRPPFIFGTLSDPREHYSYGFSPESASRAGWSGTQTDKLLSESAAGAGDVVTPHERMAAVGWALVGVAGASGACMSRVSVARLMLMDDARYDDSCDRQTGPSAAFNLLFRHLVYHRFLHVGNSRVSDDMG